MNSLVSRAWDQLRNRAEPAELQDLSPSIPWGSLVWVDPVEERPPCMAMRVQGPCTRSLKGAPSPLLALASTIGTETLVREGLSTSDLPPSSVACCLGQSDLWWAWTLAVW